ncbi:hypothetical protein [Nocardioides guangzhouensis]|uniref:hypothetical protein n=1 Tax=Nocardioides guangzhouensis TaxID=2497878 RepID=UPI0014384AF7|nr:hypothetical protein [Nocardioides guangzhouensis]
MTEYRDTDLLDLRELTDWSLGWWMVVVLATVAGAAATFAATVVIEFMTTGVCHEPTTAEALRTARWSFAGVVAVAALPWVLAILRSPHRTRLVVLGLVPLLLPGLRLVQALQASPATWTSDWCLF